MHKYAQVAVDLFCENIVLVYCCVVVCIHTLPFSCVLKVYCTIWSFIFINMGSSVEGAIYHRGWHISCSPISVYVKWCLFALYINLIFLTKPYNTVDPNSKIIACLLQQLGYAVKPIIHRTILRDAFNLVCGCPEYCHLKCWLLINLHCHSNCFLLSLPGHWINYETVHTSSQ